MSKQMARLPVSFKQRVSGYRQLPETTEPIDLTYRITYRDCFNMDYTFTKDFEYHGPIELILLQVKYEMGHYGGLKAEAIAGDLHEITN